MALNCYACTVSFNVSYCCSEKSEFASRGVVFGTFSSYGTSLLCELRMAFDLDRLVGLFNVLKLCIAYLGVGELGWLFFKVFIPNVMPAYPRSRSGPLLIV